MPGARPMPPFLTTQRLDGSKPTHRPAVDYLKRAAADGVKRAEIFFDPQQHCFTDTSGAGAGPNRDPKGIGQPKLPFKEVVLDGLCRAIDEAKAALGIDAALVLCFLQDRSTEEAMAMLEMALPYKEKILAVGMDNGVD